jgi:hypothetical protein
MQYPIPIILQFREVAFAAFYAQELFQRKKMATSKYSSTSSAASSHGGSAIGGRRLSAAPALSRTSILGSTSSSLISLSSANPPNSDFQQAMSWSDVLNMITILRDEQKGISSEVAHQQPEEEISSGGGNVLSSVREEETVKSTEVQGREDKLSMDERAVESVAVITPVTLPKSSEEMTPKKQQSSEGQEGKKISLGISLKKGGPPVEVAVPSLKTTPKTAASSASKTASSLFSSMRQGFEQLASEQSRGSPNKHKIGGNVESEAPRSSSVHAKREVLPMEVPPDEGKVSQQATTSTTTPSRASVVGDISRFNNLFAKSFNFLQEKEDELYGRYHGIESLLSTDFSFPRQCQRER